MKKKKLLWVIIPCVIVLLAAACYFAYPYVEKLWNPDTHLALTIDGSNYITLEYGSTYEEPGVKATYTVDKKNVEPVNVPVKISGEVDTSKVGEYTITYNYKCDGDTKRYPRKAEFYFKDDDGFPVIFKAVDIDNVSSFRTLK